MLQVYERMIYDHIIMEEYENLCGRAIAGFASPLPHVSELLEETWQTVNLDHISNEVDAAIKRRDHEIFGLSAKDFLHLAHRNAVQGFQIDPILVKDVQYAVHHFIGTRYVAFTDYDGSIIHSPIGGNIW